MFRLLAFTCSKCTNTFKVQTDRGDAPAGATCRVKCPRCNTVATIRTDDGELQPKPTPWAIQTVPEAAAR